MWPKTYLTDLLGNRHPIIQAPMAGSTTVELVAAVSNAGGIGSMGYSETPSETIREDAAKIRKLTDKPFNLNFFAHNAPDNEPDVIASTRERLQPFYLEVGLSEIPQDVSKPLFTFTEERLELLLEIKPPVVSFHFGLPDSTAIESLKKAGCRLLCSATTTDEAVVLEQSGVDIIVAQGWEAGGHRGSFDLNHEDHGVGTLALVPQIVDAVNVPIVAAGGIADGRGIAAAFMLGACGVQMGTAFLSCPEANVSDVHLEAIRNSRDDDTRLTKAFSGRPARARKNDYIESIAAHRLPLPDFPTMYTLSDPLREASDDTLDYRFLLYGQAAALNREMPAAELVKTLVTEAQNLL
ncbi:MAG: nitronate monooxygenase [Gammaproteobacteria bacterium]|nr:nitronate monooxygenase [Gammaproteobacteria bacterium]